MRGDGNGGVFAGMLSLYEVTERGEQESVNLQKGRQRGGVQSAHGSGASSLKTPKRKGMNGVKGVVFTLVPEYTSV